MNWAHPSLWAYAVLGSTGEILFSSFLLPKALLTLSGRCFTTVLMRGAPAPCHTLEDRDTPWSKCCAGRRLVAEVLGERAYLAVLTPPQDLAALSLSDRGERLQGVL